ncbi:tannase/feruloyl esterase family alpha/beta hydrolase [Dyadobacter subterraneus]|uniref:Tannase/feruloyl esterase family alpha/beta hydrolase n=1 Tax=Dyadobacter subterraneus TaxID=2773304 RepID=A0ABR9W7X1_9BACT|nr:tannase/feruloyl esterase family alpha/beta hydrolase [Dyadobacter subterraneus]MBE9461563.1 tannase/feruloyl esterase family alpha/beta hydrolase [Dyadobacter subterraneus]
MFKLNRFRCLIFFAVYSFSIFYSLKIYAQQISSTVSQNKDCHCQDLAKQIFPNAILTTVECVAKGSFTPNGATSPIADLPAFCRIAATLKPVSDSNIRIEVWLPEKGWNGRFLGTGNGGGAGAIGYGVLANGLKRGFATANTDMGTSPGANEIVGHPERWADFGHRATHEMTVTGKAITKAYYKKTIHHSYFAGCSTGGQQALMEAQRYPEDYDGILAGAPANNRTHLHTGFVWNFKVTNQIPGSFLPKEKVDLISNAVLKACGGKDGGAPGDNFLTDPGACDFDPKTLPVCADGKDEKTCLTKAQFTAISQIYTGPKNPRTGERIYTPLPMGSENSALGLDYQQNPNQAPSSLFYQYKWVSGPQFDYSSFNFDTDQQKMDSILAPILNANNPDLAPLKKRGGKILMYAGTADPLVPYQDAAYYYDRVVKKQGGLKQTQNFFRFFLLPGMAHCGGGPGLNDCGQHLTFSVPQDSEHDVMTALINWVEKGKAPEKIIAAAFKGGDSKSGIRFERPVFPYPQFPKYISGDVNAPSSFEAGENKNSHILAPADRYLR